MRKKTAPPTREHHGSSSSGRNVLIDRDENENLSAKKSCALDNRFHRTGPLHRTTRATYSIQAVIQFLVRVSPVSGETLGAWDEGVRRLFFDIFSKRKKRAAAITDVFRYDDIPSTLRVQCVHVIRDALRISEDYYGTNISEACRTIHDALAREYGVFTLSDEATYHRPDYQASLFNFMLRTDNVTQVLDVIELSLRVAVVVQEGYYRERPGLPVPAAIEEINQRFREEGVGYQYESGIMIRVDSTVVHQEVIKPALTVLSAPHLAGANEEFLKAHEHYRHARYKEAINESLKAFESTMKAICAKRGWAVDPRANASKLIEICFQNGLIPPYLQSEFSALRATLESGVPTVRNRTSGHGQGSTLTVVPEFIAAYLLHSTAALILLLSRADAALP